MKALEGELWKRLRKDKVFMRNLKALGTGCGVKCSEGKSWLVGTEDFVYEAIKKEVS